MHGLLAVQLASTSSTSTVLTTVQQLACSPCLACYSRLKMPFCPTGRVMASPDVQLLGSQSQPNLAAGRARRKPRESSGKTGALSPQACCCRDWLHLSLCGDLVVLVHQHVQLDAQQLHTLQQQKTNTLGSRFLGDWLLCAFFNSDCQFLCDGPCSY